MDEWLRWSGAGACWHCCMTEQHDATPCSQCNRLAKPSSLVQTNPLSCRCKVFSVSAKWMQAPVLLPVEYLQVTGSHAQDLGAMHAASVPCMTWSLIQAGLWSSTFLHLTATICCGCKVHTAWQLSLHAGVAAPLHFSQPCFGVCLSASWHLDGLDVSAKGFKAVL